MSKRRVVVTGLGILSPNGNTVSTAWDAITNGRSGIRLIDRFPTDDMETKIYGSVVDFDPEPALDKKQVRRLDTFVQYGAVAAHYAIQDSGLDITEELQPRIGVSIGSGIGGLPWIERNIEAMQKGGPRKISPFFIPGAIINMVAGFVAMQHNLRGPNISIVTACTTGTHSIGHAARMIVYGDADAMVAGGAEMASNKLGIGGFNSARALSTRNDEPEKASRPWDRDRDGFVLSEGAGVLVLEEYEFAKKRGANIYAELTGFGMSCDAYHMTAPDPDLKGFTATMLNALADAGLNPEDIQYVNAHGTSTPTADPLEAAAVKQVFGDYATNGLAVSSTKSMTGHLLGAAGAVEAIYSILAIRDGIAPPTINLDNPEEGCEDLNLVAHTAQERPIKAVLSNSFGFGGTNGTLIFQAI